MLTQGQQFLDRLVPRLGASLRHLGIAGDDLQAVGDPGERYRG
jgi:hypothetical protein